MSIMINSLVNHHGTSIALSIQQPWAWLIVTGHKDIENRNWWHKPVGKFFIHTGKKFDEEGYDYVWSHFNWINLPEPEAFKRGGLIGITKHVATVTESKSLWFFGKYGFVLRNTEPIEFVRLRGWPGFFDIRKGMEGALK